MSKNKCDCDEAIASPMKVSSSCCVTGSQSVSGELCIENESEDCCTKIIQRMDFFIKNLVPFNMPGCGMTGTILLESALRLYVGAILFADDVGYLRVTAVKDDCSVEVVNECPDCDEQVKEPGEPVAAFTMFGVGIPSCVPAIYGGGSTSGVFLNIDFLVPAIGSCIPIKVTSIEGLGDNFIISISNRLFRINSIIDTTTIEICNDGDGGQVGDQVYKDPNGDDELDVPIITVQSPSPCEADPVSVGKLLVCSSNLTQHPMEGSIEDQVPAWVPENDRFELKVIEGLATCVTIASCCLTLDPEEDPDHEYTIVVDPDTASLAIQLANVAPNYLRIVIEGYEFYLVEVVDEDTIKVIPRFVVEDTIIFEAGTTICVEGCCEQIQEVFIHGGPWYVGTSDGVGATFHTNGIGSVDQYYEGMQVRFHSHTGTTNAGATIKIGTLDTVPLTKGGGGTSLRKYDIVGNQLITAQYNEGTGSFVILSREEGFANGPNEGGVFDWATPIEAGMVINGGGTITDVNAEVADFWRVPFTSLMGFDVSVFFRIQGAGAGSNEIKIPLPSTLPGISIGLAQYECFLRNDALRFHGSWRNDTTDIKVYRTVDGAAFSDYVNTATANNEIGIQGHYRYY